MVNLYRVAALTTFLLCCSCSTGEAEKGAVFFGNFVSHQNTTDFLEQNSGFQAIEDVADSERLQQFSLDLYEFSEDMKGFLLATFFNDRLMQLIFYPTNCEGYAAHFSKLGAPKQSVEFIYDLDYRGTCYVSWSDKELQAEYEYSIR